MLEKKLAEYCKANDLPMPTSKRRKPRPVAGGVNVAEEEEGPKPKKARARVQKTYVPTYRSGPYAILLTLLDEKTSTGEGRLTKHEITTRGQVYCDASLTNPEHGKFYTAWDSMKTLIGKNLIYQSGRNYYLTDEGADIAKRMRTIASEAGPDVSAPANIDDEHEPIHDPSISRRLSNHDIGGQDTLSVLGHAQGSFEKHQSVTKSNTAMETMTLRTTRAVESRTTHNIGIDYDFDYQDSYDAWSDPRAGSGSSTSDQSSAKWRANSHTSTSYNIHASTSAKIKLEGDAKNQPVTILSDSEDDTDSAMTFNSHLCSSGSQSQILVDPTAPLSRHSLLSSSATQRGHASLGLKRVPTSALLSKQPTQTQYRPSTEIDSSAATSYPLSAASKVIGVPRSGSSSRSGLQDFSGSNHNPFSHLRSTSFTRIHSANLSSSVSIEKLARFHPIIFPPGTFEICLVLDIREVRTQTDRDYIGEKLKEKGIPTIKRALDLGDVIWVARLKDRSSTGPDELVLDYIVERKRMDDLVSSIKDGRFNEQKFRLRRSGLGHVIYLVETHRIGETYDIGADAIRTAMTQVQVNDSFFLKRTNHTDQTIEYLVSITEALRRLYESETLYAIPDEAIDRGTFLSLQSHLSQNFPDRTYLTSYSSFGSLNGKSETLVVRDTFVKMLMTIRGVSSEKAEELARVYGTPRALFSALDEAGDQVSQAQRRAILMRAVSNVGRKKIGPGLSTKVADIWYAQRYP
ncbi:Crossover junction endonuclease mus81 [Mortierella polycephala]|uniref:Crossover junction endonuclease MUS81 n=1 Tax=Mortierella polycephala TaxID=41804 RepID=A0A9P6PNY6_9FUNG|nr:Crossover junction endonuclease mus81 [Mortierella polycephala]